MFEQGRRLGLRQATIDLGLMMARGRSKKLHAAVDGTALWVKGAVIKPADAGERDGAGAHRARLERYIKVAIGKALGAERGGRCTDRDHFSMRSRIAVGQRTVAGTGDNAAVMHNNAADRDLSALPGRASLLKRRFHECAGHE